jgi:chromosome segregation ATPase
MALLNELEAQLAALNTQLEKATTEIKTEIGNLETQLGNVEIPAGAQAALDSLKAKVQALDDLNPDAPAPTT